MNGPSPDAVLGSATDRKGGREARRIVLRSARAVAGAVRTTLGPYGMDKLVLGEAEDNVTRDARTIIDEMDIEHPVASLVAELALAQGEVHGDGVTSAVVLASELLEEADGLVERGLHPNTIVRGYTLASRRADDTLDRISRPVLPDDTDLLRDVARTNMAGSFHRDADEFAALVVDAVRTVEEPDRIETDLIKVKSVVDATESEFVEGMVLEREPVHREMTTPVEDATVALVDTDLAVSPSSELAADPTLTPETPEARRGFRDAERAHVARLADRIADSGADVVVCRTSIGDRMALELRDRGVFAVEFVVTRNMRRLARTTGARVVGDVEALTPDHLGHVGRIDRRTVGAEDFEYLVFEGGSGPGMVSFVFRGKSEEAKRAVKRGTEGGFDAVRTAMRDGELVPGGGASETALALDLEGYAPSVGGREQLAVRAFAEALETIPRTLAENAGLTPVDALTDLRAQHARGNHDAGILGTEGVSPDVAAEGVLEPRSVKESTVVNAADIANLLVGVDGLYTPREFIERVSEEQTEQVAEMTEDVLAGFDEQVESIAENAG